MNKYNPAKSARHLTGDDVRRPYRKGNCKKQGIKSLCGNNVNPEDLHRIALLTTPQSTPVFSAFGAGWDCTASRHDWPIDKLNAASTTPKQEGAAISPADIPAVVRMQNYTQLMDRSYVISDRQQAITQKNGLNIGIGVQMKKATIELKRDMEKSIITNSTTSAETSSAASVAGGIPFFLDTSNGTWGSMVQAVDCSSKALQEDAHVLTLLQKMYVVHDPEDLTMIVSPKNKMKIDKFTGGAMRQLDAKSGTLYNDIKIMRTAFGDVTMMISRLMPDTSIYILDMEYWKKSFLQPIQAFDISGTSFKNKHGIEKGVMAEYTVECRNPAAGGVLQNVG